LGSSFFGLCGWFMVIVLSLSDLSLSRSTSSQLAREHVTNIDGEVESWQPDTNNQIWKSGSMHMKTDICRVPRYR